MNRVDIRTCHHVVNQGVQVLLTADFVTMFQRVSASYFHFSQLSMEAYVLISIWECL